MGEGGIVGPIVVEHTYHPWAYHPWAHTPLRLR